MTSKKQTIVIDRESDTNPPVSSLRRTISKQNQPIINRPPAITDFVAEDLKDISVGMCVEHQRFGKGTVTALEGNVGSEKATINFAEFGEKTLVLKFAKLRRS